MIVIVMDKRKLGFQSQSHFFLVVSLFPPSALCYIIPRQKQKKFTQYKCATFLLAVVRAVCMQSAATITHVRGGPCVLPYIPSKDDHFEHSSCSSHQLLDSVKLTSVLTSNDCDHLERFQPKMTHPQPQEISTLDKVPDEILNEIFTYIAIDSPFRDECGVLGYGTHPLLPVVQVNKRFNAVASPLMVRKCRLALTDQTSVGAGFVLHLLRKPHLRSQVKSLALDVLSFDPAWFDDGTPAARGNRWPRSFIPTAECEQLIESAEKACPPAGSHEV
jgi:hypothetical protein